MLGRRALVSSGAAVLLAAGLAGCSAQAPASTSSSAASAAPGQASAAQAMPSGAAGGGGTGKTMTAAATARLAEALGVTSAQLTAAITKARSSGPGVNLVRTLSSEPGVSQAKVAAGLKALGPDGPDDPVAGTRTSAASQARSAVHRAAARIGPSAPTPSAIPGDTAGAGAGAHERRHRWAATRLQRRERPAAPPLPAPDRAAVLLHDRRYTVVHRIAPHAAARTGCPRHDPAWNSNA